MSPVLEVAGLTKRFGELQVLNGIDLTIADLGVHSIIGPNGAGKTTLFNCITGVVKPDEGTVTLGGRDITKLSVVRRVRLGLVRTFQVSRLFDSIPAQENVRLAVQKSALGGRLGLRLGRAAPRRIEERCRELLDEVGLPTANWALPCGMQSHADRRAVELAMALACDPTVLCLDEPTAGIGIGEAEQMAELIGRLGERLAVLLIEHRMSLVQRVSKQVSVLAHGSLLAQGPPAAIAADQRVQDAYLGRAAGAVAARPDPGRRSAALAGQQNGSLARPAEDLVLREIHTYYGSSHVLHGVSLTARREQVSAILGRNGAGKTTTLATIMNLVKARSGSIQLGRRELTGLPTHSVAALGIALVPESRWVFPDLTVEENLRVAAGRRRALDEAYAEFPALAERRQARGSELSGGQQQMVALARTLLRGASVILLDEPTQGLSPAYVAIVIGYIRRLRERGATVVLVEQNIDVVAAVADTVYLMRDGHVPAELAAAALDPNNALIQESLLLEPASAPHELPAARSGGPRQELPANDR